MRRDSTGAAPAVLTLSGVAAAFGLASCCALPMLLYSFGFGTAWLGGIGLFAALHDKAFLVVALAGLLGGAIALVWQRHRLRPAVLWVMSAALLIGGVLLWAGVTYV